MAGQTPSEPWSAQADTTEAAADGGNSMADTVKSEVSSFADAAKDKAQQTVEEKKGVASEALADFANAVRRAGEELSQNDRSAAGRMASQAAEGLQGLSRTVSEKRPEELLDAAREFGRANPAAVIAGSVLAGVMFGRFLRASEKSGGQGGMARQDDLYSQGGGSYLVGADGGMGDGSAMDETWPADTGSQSNEGAQDSDISRLDPALQTMGSDASSDIEEVTGALGRDPRTGDAGAADGEG